MFQPLQSQNYNNQKEVIYAIPKLYKRRPYAIPKLYKRRPYVIPKSIPKGGHMLYQSYTNRRPFSIPKEGHMPYQTFTISYTKRRPYAIPKLYQKEAICYTKGGHIYFHMSISFDIQITKKKTIDLLYNSVLLLFLDPLV